MRWAVVFVRPDLTRAQLADRLVTGLPLLLAAQRIVAQQRQPRASPPTRLESAETLGV